MKTWKIIVVFQTGETMTRYFNNYNDAVKEYVTYWNENTIKAILEEA